MSRSFRVWDNQVKSYDLDREFVISPNGNLMELRSNHNGTWDYHFADEDRFIVEQDTGLEDKNGKEICEGDIVKWTNGLNKTMFYEVYFNECRATFLLNPIDGEMTEGMSDEKKPYIEVIGNMNENPEWLGGED